MTKHLPELNLFTRSDFKQLMGDDWYKLHPEIQNRFALEHCHKTTVYRGIMGKVSMSFAGRLLAQFARLLGTPLSYNAGTDVPTEVCVYPNDKIGGTTWDRFYKFGEQQVNRVRSSKVILPDCGLIEVAISGFGMYSKVYAEAGAIVFESKRFFFTAFGRKLPIPHLLSPGKTIARQRALKNGEFEFTLDISHPILGKVFEQIGHFSEVE